MFPKRNIMAQRFRKHIYTVCLIFYSITRSCGEQPKLRVCWVSCRHECLSRQGLDLFASIKCNFQGCTAPRRLRLLFRLQPKYATTRKSMKQISTYFEVTESETIQHWCRLLLLLMLSLLTAHLVDRFLFYALCIEEFSIFSISLLLSNNRFYGTLVVSVQGFRFFCVWCSPWKLVESLSRTVWKWNGMEMWWERKKWRMHGHNKRHGPETRIRQFVHNLLRLTIYLWIFDILKSYLSMIKFYLFAFVSVLVFVFFFISRWMDS